MKALIAYESQAGHTRQAAEAIAAAVQKLGGDAIVKPIAQVQVSDAQEASAIFIGTWVQGLVLFGVRPANAEKWVPALPPLAGKPVGVYCTYAFNPRGAMRALGAMLEARGAAVKGEHAFHRTHPGEGAEPFVRSVFEMAGLPIPLPH